MKARLWFIVLAAWPLASAGVPASADDAVPGAAAIREHVRAAAGPLADAFRETDVTVASDGSTTTERDYRRGKDLRIVFDRGPFHTERGIRRGTAWHMNDNGQIIVDDPDPGVATRDVFKTTVAAVHEPVEGYVIASLNAAGYGSKEYVDAAAWHTVRRDRITANGTIVSTFDDFRLDHGRTFAHHVRVDDGYAKTSSDVRIMEYAPDTVSEADVDVPQPRRRLVEFPAGVTSVHLPAKFGPSHVYVRVVIGGRGLDFVLDSGASGITIDSGVARELGLPEFDKRSAVTAGRYTTARTIVPEMRVGDLRLHDVAVQEVPQGWDTLDGVKEVGLLGFDFLAELGVTIDYEGRTVTVVPAAAYTPPSDPTTIPVDVRIGSGHPRATVSLNGVVGERWVLDTGGAGTFLIFDAFARRHPEALRDEGAGTERDAQLRGIGGAIPVRPYQIASLRLGNVDFTHFVGYRVTEPRAYAGGEDGIVGVKFLQLFTLGFDYANRRVYLTPNADGRWAMGVKEHG